MKHLFVVVIVAVLATNAFATDGTRMVGFNAKTIGRGGTTLGLFDDASLMMTNPAGTAAGQSCKGRTNHVLPLLYV